MHTKNLDEIVEGLKLCGVVTKNPNGSYANIPDIFRSIADIWRDLTQKEQDYVAELMFGAI